MQNVRVNRPLTSTFPYTGKRFLYTFLRVGEMDETRSEFLTTMIGILNRLHRASVKHNEPHLASMLLIARGEAEDSLRHASDLELLASERRSRSSTYTWRACDLPPEEDLEPSEDERSRSRSAQFAA